MKRDPADVVREYGPFAGVKNIGGVSYDGERIWLAVGQELRAIDPASGDTVRSIDIAAQAGTAFDGRHLYQVSDGSIRRIDPDTGAILATIPAPAGGGDSGLAWAEGWLWVGDYRGRRIHQVDPGTGEVLRSIESNRFVTGVSWADGELWHATWEGEESELRRLDPRNGSVVDALAMPPGTFVSGLESDGADLFYCGGGGSARLRAVRKPRRRRGGST